MEKPKKPKLKESKGISLPKHILPRYILRTGQPFLYEIAKDGLENRNELNSKKQNEVKFLDHIKTIIDSKSTNAEVIMAKYLKDKNFFTVHEK